MAAGAAIAIAGALAMPGSAIGAAPPAPNASTARPAVAPGRVIVKFRQALAARIEGQLSPGLRLAAGDAADPLVTQFLARHRVQGMAPLHRAFVAQKMATGLTDQQLAAETRQRFAARARRVRATVASPALSRAYVVDVTGDPQQAAAELAADPDVEYAEPDHVVTASLVPNDPYFGSTGTWGQSYDDLWGIKKIGAPAAWDTTAGAGITVAVVDTGLDYTHPDIVDNVWTNTGEIPGNGIDDDGNGYVDDVRGWDFIGSYYGSPTSDNDPLDGHGHGTHVSGTIAAEGNNGLGVIGVAWQAKVMPVKGLDDYGYGLDSTLANAIVYAANNGADVINASWGGPGTSATIADAINYASGLGVVVVVAAGNSTDDARFYYPSGLPNVITVAASTSYDSTAYFSNWGSKIDVSAPGLDILSLRANGTTMGTPVGTGYTRADGTSMASPHVAGLAALILARHPSWSTEDVRQALRTSATDVGLPGYDLDHGYGRINAAAAVAVTSVLQAKITAPADGTKVAGPTAISGIARGTGFVSYTLEYGAGYTPSSWTLLQQGTTPVSGATLGTFDPSGLADGVYALRLTAVDSSGHAFVDRLQMVVDYVSVTSPAPPRVPTVAAVFKPGTVVPVTGTATGATFQSYRVEWARGVNPASGWTATGMTLPNGGTAPVTAGVLGQWDTGGISIADYYTVRVVVQDSGFTSEARTIVYLEPDLLSANWPQWLDEASTDSAVLPLRDAGGALRLSLANPKWSISAVPAKVRTFSPAGTLLSSSTMFGAASYGANAVGNVDGVPGDEVVVGESGSVKVFRSDNTTYYLSPPSPPAGTFINFQAGVVLIEDVDGDGANETLAVGTNFNLNTASLYAWKTNGQQLAGFPITVSNQNISEHYNDGPKALVADIDGDGAKDIVIVESTSSSTTRLRLFSANGTPRTWAAPTFDGYVIQMAVADLDHDGMREIVAVSVGSSGTAVHVLEPDGTERPGWPMTTSRTGSHLAIGDLDRDGHDEIILSVYSTLFVLKGDGTSFSPAWPRVEGVYNTLGAVTVADVDGDGYPEILVSRQELGVSPNPLVAGAAKPEDTAEADAPPVRTLQRGALDEDGRQLTQQVAITAYPSQSTLNPTLLVLRRDNTIARSWRLLGANGNQPTEDARVTVGDFDGNGTVDLAVVYTTILGGGTGGYLQEGVLEVLTTGAAINPNDDWPSLYHDARNTAALLHNDVAPPSVAITSPAAGSTVSGIVSVTATASDDAGVAGVRFQLDGVDLGPEDTTPPYGLTWDSRLSAQGAHTLTAVARDVGGHLTTSAPVTVTADNDLVPPTVTLTWPTPGAVLSGLVAVSADAADNRAVTKVEFYLDNALRATDTAAPYGWSWDTTVVADGGHAVFARAYDAAGNTADSAIASVTVSNGLATYDAQLRTARCTTVGSLCDSGPSLLRGRGPLGPEPNQPNTIGATCADDTSGSFHSDESNDRIRVFTLDGTPMAQGKTVRVEATVWAYTGFASDHLDLYSAPNATAPVWTYITTLTPTAAGAQVLSATFALPPGATQAVRARFRYLGSPAPCGALPYTDHDDLVFAVGPSAHRPVANAGGPYSGSVGQPVAFNGTGSSDADGNALTYAWTFGDGATGTGPTPSHTYTTGGSYTAQLVVSDGMLASDPVSVPVVVVDSGPSVALTVASVGGATGFVTVSPPNADCATDGTPSHVCNYSYGAPVSVSLTPHFPFDVVFTGWSGACTGTSVCNVNVVGPTQVTATFSTLQTLTVTVDSTEGGLGAVNVTPPAALCVGTLGTPATCSYAYPLGTVVTLDASPSPNSVFVGWSGSCQSPTPTCTVTVDQAKSVSAMFRGPQSLGVTVDSMEGGLGLVNVTPPGAVCTGAIGTPTTCSYFYQVGTVVTLDASPSPNSVFVGWSGACQSPTPTCTVTMDQAKFVSAMFRGPQSLGVTVDSTEGGLGSVNVTPPSAVCAGTVGAPATCSYFYRVGTEVTLSASPSPNSVFVGWSGACQSPTPTCTVTMDQAKFVSAMFRGPQPLGVTVDSADGGVGSVSVTPPGATCDGIVGMPATCSYFYRVGTDVILTAAPSPSSVFVGWSGSCQSPTPTCTVTVDQARFVSALFRGPQPVTVTVDSVEGGRGSVTVTPPGATCVGQSGAPSTCTYFVRAGASVTVDATPEFDSAFTGWAGACQGATGSCVLTVTGPTALGASFRGPQPVTVTLTSTEGAQGAVTVSSEGKPPKTCDLGGLPLHVCTSLEHVGAILTFTPAAGPNSRLSAWTGACTGTGPCVVTVGGPVSVGAAFVIKNHPPVASAGGPYTGVRGVAIAFDGGGSTDVDGDPLTYTWSFGDGATGSGRTPTHVYGALGPFTVTLVVNDGTVDSPPAPATVTITNRPPVAQAGGPYAGVRGQAIAFDGSASSDPDGDGLTYAWDFGDGGTATGVAPSHVYATMGTFPVTLVVNDGLAASSPATSPVTIANRPPVANPGGPYAAVRGQAITFNGGGSSDPDGDSLTYAWTFGDGSTGTGPSPTHAYATVGAFTVTLVVNDGTAASAPATGAVTIANRPPVASAGGPYSGVRGQSVAFNGGGSTDPDGDPLTYAWTLGDGSTGTGPAPTHAYATLGTFTVTLVVNDGYTSSPAATTTVTVVNRPPVANAGGPYSGLRGLAVAFNGGGSSDPDGDPLTYAWTFGDGTTGSGPNPTHAYATLGTFTVTLVVNDGFTNSAPATTTVTLSNRPPIANAGPDRTVTRRTSVTLDGTASSDPDGSITAYSWRQLSGPTVSLTGANTSRPRFTAPNVTTPTNLTFELRVTDNNGATATDQVVITVVR